MRGFFKPLEPQNQVYYQLKFYQIFCGIFSYQGIDTPIHFINNWFYHQGKIAIYIDDEDDDKVKAAEVATVITKDEYLDPVTFKGRLPDGTEKTMTTGPDDGVSKAAVIVYNSTVREVIATQIFQLCLELGKIDDILAIKRDQYTTPYIFMGDADTKKTFDAIINSIKNKVLSITLNSGYVDMESVKVLNLDVPYITDKLMSEKEYIYREACQILGFDYAIVDKKERLITNEVISKKLLPNLAFERLEKARDEGFALAKERLGATITYTAGEYDGLGDEPTNPKQNEKNGDSGVTPREELQDA